jgi:hypothetical protein
MMPEEYPEMYMPPGDGPCIPQETVIENVRLAHAYVPFEKMCYTFDPLTALKKGTAFPPLFNIYGWEKGEEYNYE